MFQVCAGEEQSIAQTSNAKGMVILRLKVSGQPHGSVMLVQVEVMYQGMTDRTSTSFRIWQ